MEKTKAQIEWDALSGPDRFTYDVEWILLHRQSAEGVEYLRHAQFTTATLAEADRVERIRALARAIQAEIKS